MRNEVAVELPDRAGAQFPGLVANVRGAERALSAGVTYLRVVLSVSEGHSLSNTNRSVDEGIEETAAMLERAAQAPGVRVAAGLATAFDCPFDGAVPLAQLDRVVDALAGLGIDEISLADTLGKADPMHVRRAVATVQAEHPAIDVRAAPAQHVRHASANVLAGLELGVWQFDAALGGIGGCPFAPGAAGNIATEDVVFMLERMGIATGIDLDALAKVAGHPAGRLGRPWIRPCRGHSAGSRDPEIVGDDMSNLTLRNGVVVTPGGLRPRGLVGHRWRDHPGRRSTPTCRQPASIDIDVNGKYLLPGVIDPHVHLGVGPGAGAEKMQRDFVTESRDAASGGVTTMITTTLFGSGSRGEVAEAAIKAGNEHSLVDYRLTAVITTREQLGEAADLVKLGLRSFKFFLGYKGAQAESFGMNVDGISWDFFYQACESLGAAGAKAFPTIHAEDP